MSRSPRDYFIYTIKSCIGRPYRWGGQDVSGFDCSGLVIFALNNIGIPISDTNAQGLFIFYQHKQVDRMQAPPGSLYFYGENRNKITHVMTVIEHWNDSGIILVGARGGDSTTTTLERASQRKAFVDACWGDYWLDKFVCAVDPFN